MRKLWLRATSIESLMGAMAIEHDEWRERGIECGGEEDEAGEWSDGRNRSAPLIWASGQGTFSHTSKLGV